MKWKKILMSVLFFLTRLERWHEKEGLIPVEERPPKDSRVLNLMSPSMENVVRSVSAPAVVSFGPKCSEPLPRSQVLSLLRSDCQASERAIEWLVVHCSATRPSTNYTIERLKRDHAARNFGPWPGYHLYVRRDGTMYYCRPIRQQGCHVEGWNKRSIGVCYEGGISDSPEYHAEDNRTAEQVVVLHEVLSLLKECYPQAVIKGHREFPGVAKACPCFLASREYRYLG